MQARASAEPSVSVVIPSFDTAELARAAVASVLAQTHRDFEILLVDDGSRPEQAAVLDTLVTDPRVRLLRQANAGPDRARRAGWEAAGAEWVAFLDDDDRFEPRHLERCLARAAAQPELGAVYTRYRTVGPEGEPRALLPKHGYSGRILAREVTKGTVKTSTLMARRAHLLALTGLVEHTRASGNYDLILRLAQRCAFGFVDEVLVRVTLRPGSISKDLSRRHLDRSEILENLLRVHPELEAAERRAVRAKIGKYLCKAAARSERLGRVEEARGLLRRSLRHRASPRALAGWLRCTAAGAFSFRAPSEGGS